MTTLDEAYGHVANWQGDTFPDATLDGAVAHLKKEVLEVVNANALRHHVSEQDFNEEVADVFFMLVQVCEQRGIHLADEVMRKLGINQQRAWPTEPAADGCYHHEKEEDVFEVGDIVEVVEFSTPSFGRRGAVSGVKTVDFAKSYWVKFKQGETHLFQASSLKKVSGHS